MSDYYRLVWVPNEHTESATVYLGFSILAVTPSGANYTGKGTELVDAIRALPQIAPDPTSVKITNEKITIRRQTGFHWPEIITEIAYILAQVFSLDPDQVLIEQSTN